MEIGQLYKTADGRTILLLSLSYAKNPKTGFVNPGYVIFGEEPMVIFDKEALIKKNMMRVEYWDLGEQRKSGVAIEAGTFYRFFDEIGC